MTALDETHSTPAPTLGRAVHRSTLIRAASVLVVLAALAAAPYVVSVTVILTLEEIAAFAVFAVAANLLIGQAGLISFGQGVFFGLGAYTVTLGWEHAHWSFWIGFALAPVLGAVAAVPIGLVALRARTLYFALITLAFSELFYQLVEQNTDFTGGANGVFAPVVPAWMKNPVNGYLTLLGIAVAALAVLRWIYASNFGLLLRASRENRCPDTGAWHQRLPAAPARLHRLRRVLCPGRRDAGDLQPGLERGDPHRSDRRRRQT